MAGQDYDSYGDDEGKGDSVNEATSHWAGDSNDQPSTGPGEQGGSSKS